MNDEPPRRLPQPISRVEKCVNSAERVDHAGAAEVERTNHEGLPQSPRSPPADESALAALRAQVEALAHELEVLRHDHHQLYTYHHHLRFRLAERANLWLRGMPRAHRLLGWSYLLARDICRRLRLR